MALPAGRRVARSIGTLAVISEVSASAVPAGSQTRSGCDRTLRLIDAALEAAEQTRRPPLFDAPATDPEPPWEERGNAWTFRAKDVRPGETFRL